MSVPVRFSLKAAKGQFFDRKKVMNAIAPAERRVLSQFGAFVRTAAKSSIKKRKKASPPGTPPSSHTGDLKRGIFFAFDPRKRSVVVGPTRFDGRPGDAPSTLEFGGFTGYGIHKVALPGGKGRFLKDRIIKIKGRLRIRKRPYMEPAMQQELPKFPQLWNGTVKG